MASCSLFFVNSKNCPKILKDQRKLNPAGRDAMRTDGHGDW